MGCPRSWSTTSRARPAPSPRPTSTAAPSPSTTRCYRRSRPPSPEPRQECGAMDDTAPVEPGPFRALPARGCRLLGGAGVGMTDVEIAGVGLHPFGRFGDTTVTELGVTAVRAALEEAGVGRGGFQAAFCGTAYGGVAAGHKVLAAMGMTGGPIVDVEAGCASGGAALMLAAAAIPAGQDDTRLVFRIQEMPRRIIPASFLEALRGEAE